MLDVLVVGGGPAGLAAAAMSEEAGRTSLVVEKGARAGDVWRSHYDRLHLHTPREISYLPGYEMPDDLPRYPSRDQFGTYLDDYVKRFDLDIRFGAEVAEIKRHGSAWSARLADGSSLEAKTVVIAMGTNSDPNPAKLPGEENFTGTILHSSAYTDPSPFSGQRVLVVGFGNSGGEIALDLSEKGLEVALSVRSPVNILPRELFGRPIARFGILWKLFWPRWADRIAGPLIRSRIGRPRDYGFEEMDIGPITMLAERGRIPLIDIGTLPAIAAGKIAVRPGIASMDGDRVTFVDGRTDRFDSIVAATGFRPDLRHLLPDAHAALDENGKPRTSGAPSGCDELYFCGYRLAAGGMLTAIREDALALRDLLAERTSRTAA